MKKLASAKTRTIFETSGNLKERGRWRQIIIEAHPQHGLVRLKGTRRALLFSWEGLYIHCAKLEADRVRAEKQAARKARRK